MSEFKVEVVQIGEVRKHENADSLSITKVHGGYPCVIRTGDFKEGNKVVYIPVDSLVPLNDPRFAFLRKDCTDDEYPELGLHRVKAVRLRGIFSMGLLIPAEPNWEIGQSVQKELGIIKYEPPEIFQMEGENGHCPFTFPTYTDIGGLRRWSDVFQEGEPVVITEKLHGANARFIWKDGKLWVGSHTQVKREDPKNLWWKVAYQYDLADKLRYCPDLVLYGEIYGCVQDLRYDHEKGKVSLAFFDVFDLWNDNFFSADSSIFETMNLPQVPTIYKGPWDKKLIELGEGNTLIDGANHVREGFVVKPLSERFDDRIGRVILKYHGQDFLCRKEKIRK